MKGKLLLDFLDFAGRDHRAIHLQKYNILQDKKKDPKAIQRLSGLPPWFQERGAISRVSTSQMSPTQSCGC